MSDLDTLQTDKPNKGQCESRDECFGGRSNFGCEKKYLKM